MLSLFTFFDALSAESLGRKVSLSWPSTERKTEERRGSSAADGLKRDRDNSAQKESRNSAPGKDTPSPSVSRNQISRKTLKKNPRFAVELDGVHCFETIVPY
ncbi:hypothetical protein Ancab_008981 [Ancistrocladus abbreviatus]